MRLTYKEIELKPEKSFSVQRANIPCLEEDWHFHKELELFYIIKSTGTRYVGNSVNRFEPNELYLIGSDLPHLFRNDKEYYKNSIINTKTVDVIIIKFKPDFLGNYFLNLTELQAIKFLFQEANKGLKFSKHASKQVHDLLIQLVKSEGTLSILKLLEILHLLSSNKNYKLLCPKLNNFYFRKDEKEKMAKIINYLNTNFDKKIDLKTIASIAHMTPNSFCRYFKKHTHKSFSQFLNEIRIRNACKLLIQGELQITTICYQSGFNTITNFNRQFKSFIGITPSDYLKKYEL
ncbi:AraC family transcriptional regulator [Aquimarina aggregata]|uniref:AraC family transcriptional regulator n=1 Tax=Aquimarina aggregata TaxID=1642818 RepID=A0A162XZT8_9FLAO|nr:AraC family transcriptional regulator [Aquimarina aggregata]KZS38858.1 AraC family transcriptional regulator [Aquimarina aggregata]